MTDIECDTGQSNLELLRVLTQDLRGVPRDADLKGQTKEFVDNEGKRVTWRTLYADDGRFQLVEARFDAGTEFACHLDKTLLHKCAEHPTKRPECRLNHYYMPYSGRCRLRFHDVGDPSQVTKEITLTNVGYGVKSGVPHSLVAEMETVMFVVLIPAERGL